MAEKPCAHIIANAHNLHPLGMEAEAGFGASQVGGAGDEGDTRPDSFRWWWGGSHGGARTISDLREQ